LQNDKRVIFSTAGHAPKAVDYLHRQQLSPDEDAEKGR
jgi:antirestriction protein ArdC